MTELPLSATARDSLRPQREHGWRSDHHRRRRDGEHGGLAAQPRFVVISERWWCRERREHACGHLLTVRDATLARWAPAQSSFA